VVVVTRYRKRPVEVEAQQLTVENALNLSSWCSGPILWDSQGEAIGVVVPTLEDPLRARIGDWIIQGIAGEFYPCRDDIFQATHELANDHDGGIAP
jgi:hypothetical protein